jgi:23S rRNA A2030 N6-methylase RlmJ
MIGTGMWMLNPPFGIEEECARLDAMFRGLGNA